MKKVSVKGDYGFDRGIGGSEIRDLQGLLNSRRTQMATLASNGFGAPEHKMEFVKNIRESAFDRRLVKYTVELCHSLNIRVCIEGVEEEPVYDIVTKDCRADFIQGYFFGRPVSEHDFEALYIDGDGGTL